MYKAHSSIPVLQKFDSERLGRPLSKGVAAKKMPRGRGSQPMPMLALVLALLVLVPLSLSQDAIATLAVPDADDIDALIELERANVAVGAPLWPPVTIAFAAAACLLGLVLMNTGTGRGDKCVLEKVSFLLVSRRCPEMSVERFSL